MKFLKIYPPYFQCHLVSPVTLFHNIWLREREGIAIVISGTALGNTLSYCIYYAFVFINHKHSQPIEYP